MRVDHKSVTQFPPLASIGEAGTWCEARSCMAPKNSAPGSPGTRRSGRMAWRYKWIHHFALLVARAHGQIENLNTERMMQTRFLTLSFFLSRVECLVGERRRPPSLYPIAWDAGI